MARAFVVVTAVIAMVLITEVSAQDAPPAPPADARVYDMGWFCPGRMPQRVMPERAVMQRINGRALLECVVNDDRRVTSCQVVEEEPAGIGFGRSALTLACRHSQRYYGQPLDERIAIFARADGASRVRMPMRFNVEGASPSN